VQEAVAASGIKDGICCVYSPHTTCSVRVNEFETGFLEDFAVLLKRLVPQMEHIPYFGVAKGEKGPVASPPPGRPPITKQDNGRRGDSL
jgi:thiamine phosphate synthase YjbQ (UPF0047 family)